MAAPPIFRDPITGYPTAGANVTDPPATTFPRTRNAGRGPRGPGTPPAPAPRVPLTPAQADAIQNRAEAANRAAHPQGADMTPQQVRSMQQFLVNRGFNVAQDGVYGPSTKSAAQAFRTNHKGGAEWSNANGIGVHPSNTPHDTTGANPPTPPTPPSTPAGPTPGSDSFSQLLATLLKQGGNVGSMFDPKSFGNAAAAPSDALASTLARQAAANPKQEAQNQSDISSWYGLDPKASSYKLSVLGRLLQAKTADATAATNASSNVSDLAKQLASSIGGSANDGSGMVASAGADAAGTMSAVGQASTDYANAMDPLLAAEARGSMSKEHATNSAALLDLQDKLAQARGQATSDRAGGVASATDKNNALGQQGFANKGNLLAILAQMQSVDPLAAGLKDAKLAAEINRLQNPAPEATSPATRKGIVQTIAQNVIGTFGLSLSPDNANGTGGLPVVPTNGHAQVAQLIGNYLVRFGIKRGSPEFKQIGDQIFSTFIDQHGRPLASPPNWGI